MVRWVVCLALVGCRAGFDVAVEADAPSSSVDDAPDDAPAGSVVVTFGETPTAGVQGVTADTYLNSESTQVSYNFGASPSLSVEGSQKRALLRFDLAAVPASATIVAVRLHLWVAYIESGTSTISIAPLREAWTEGTQTSGAGVANYNQRTGTQSWTTAGAGSPGSSGAAIGSFDATAVGAISIDLPVATVQGWVATPSSNFGFAFSSGGGSDLRLSSANATTPTERPELVVTYLP